MSSCFPSAQELPGLACSSGKDLGQTIRRTSLLCLVGLVVMETARVGAMSQMYPAAGNDFLPCHHHTQPFSPNVKENPVSEQGTFLSSRDTLSQQSFTFPQADCTLLTWAWQLLVSFWMTSFLELGQAENVPDFKHCFYNIV